MSAASTSRTRYCRVRISAAGSVSSGASVTAASPYFRFGREVNRAEASCGPATARRPQFTLQAESLNAAVR